MPCRAGVYAPNHSRLVLEDILGLERDPVARESAVAGGVFDRNSGMQLLEFLDVRASGAKFELSQLFVRTR